MTILLIGRQGAGKGLTGRLLADRIGGEFFSMGDVLRAEQVRDSDLGRQIGDLIDAGEDAPPDVSYGLMATALAERTRDRPLVLDGVPRRADQTARVRDLLGEEPDKVIVLDVPVPIAIHRVLTRQTCTVCGMPHGPGWPTLKGRCRSCAGAVGERDDDNDPQKIRRRLEVWDTGAEAITAYYEELGVLLTVASAPPPLEVLQRVLGTLGQ